MIGSGLQTANKECGVIEYVWECPKLIIVCKSGVTVYNQNTLYKSVEILIMSSVKDL